MKKIKGSNLCQFRARDFLSQKGQEPILLKMQKVYVERFERSTLNQSIEVLSVGKAQASVNEVSQK